MKENEKGFWDWHVILNRYANNQGRQLFIVFRHPSDKTSDKNKTHPLIYKKKNDYAEFE